MVLEEQNQDGHVTGGCKNAVALWGSGGSIAGGEEQGYRVFPPMMQVQVWGIY